MIVSLLVPYTIGFFLVALIERAWPLMLVSLSLIAACLSMILGSSFEGAGSALVLPTLVALMLGIFGGFLGRALAIAGEFETATKTLVITFLSIIGIIGLLIALTT
ncbi:hypothetical protein QA648_15845 [Rhizobium sp. CB3171]|uniref:hypothetical protein n=1 Tax=Rhizobium sp. CB3171 TaxID=3039157 RepID=UPI0024B0A5C2|nr:hypothetical protein [Rhizobium sp. CB3171]WFU01584.1 hypothetical protein QA648_15845 [Rhizobium sp. CB3171]